MGPIQSLVNNAISGITIPKAGEKALGHLKETQEGIRANAQAIQAQSSSLKAFAEIQSGNYEPKYIQQVFTDIGNDPSLLKKLDDKSIDALSDASDFVSSTPLEEKVKFVNRDYVAGNTPIIMEKGERDDRRIKEEFIQQVKNLYGGKAVPQEDLTALKTRSKELADEAVKSNKKWDRISSVIENNPSLKDKAMSILMTTSGKDSQQVFENFIKNEVEPIIKEQDKIAESKKKVSK